MNATTENLERAERSNADDAWEMRNYRMDRELMLTGKCRPEDLARSARRRAWVIEVSAWLLITAVFIAAATVVSHWTSFT